MPRDPDHDLERELEGAPRDDESMDVLLQLTLPIVLILAFLVVTEVAALHGEIDFLKSLLGSSSAEEVSKDMDFVILSLQLQILVKVSDDVASTARDELGISTYGSEAPSAQEIVAGSLSDSFKLTSRNLKALLDAPPASSPLLRQLRKESNRRFKEEVAEVTRQRPQLSPAKRLQLLEITRENRQYLEDKLLGHVGTMREDGVRVQQQIFLDWIRADSRADLERSAELFEKGVRGERTAWRELVRVPGASLAERLADLDAPLLSATAERWP